MINPFIHSLISTSDVKNVIADDSDVVDGVFCSCSCFVSPVSPGSIKFKVKDLLLNSVLAMSSYRWVLKTFCDISKA